MALSTHITNALDHACSYADSIDNARKDAKGMTHAQVRVVILPVVSRKYAVALVAGAGKAQGMKVFDKEATNYEAAKRAATRLLNDICGVESSGKKETVTLPKGIVRTLTNEIIEAGLTKAQFNELLAQLRDSVSFQ